MDPVIRARDYLRDNVGHLTRPGNASYHPASQRWFVPIRWRTTHGDVVIGDLELDREGHLVYAPSKEELLLRAEETMKKFAEPLPEASVPKG
jgi:hypothetical protein